MLKFYSLARRWNRQRSDSCAVIAVAALALAWLFSWASPAYPAVISSGDVDPVPPIAGGEIDGPFHVGEEALGTLGINAGTPLEVTGSSVIGVLEEGFGIVALDGLDSDWTSTNDLTVADEGKGFLDISGALLSQTTTVL